MSTHNQIIFALFIGLISGSTALAQEYNKKWNKSFNVESTTTFGVEHKYGDIEIKTWDQPKIQVDVTMSVSGKSDKKLQEIIDNITIEDKSTGADIKLETDYGVKINNVDIDVDYVIMMPNNIPLKLVNAFGNIALADAKAATKIVVEYGNLKAGKLSSPDNDLELDFSNGNVQGINGGKLNVDYGNLEVDQLGNIDAKTSFSNLEIDHATNLELHSEYDNYEIGDIIDFDVEAQFSNIEIDLLKGSLKGDVSYTGFEIDEVSASFTSIYFDGEMGGIELEFENGASYGYDLYSSMGDVDMSCDCENSKEEIRDHHKHIIGVKGRKPENRTVHIKVTYGEIELD